MAANLLDLVKQHRSTHTLYRPFKIDSPEPSSDEFEPEPEPEPESLSEDDEDWSEEHNQYYFGHITSGLAAKLLKGKDPGTFLVRKNVSQFKLSWLNFDGKLMHTLITLDASKYSITSQKKFPTIHELIMFYQNQEQSYKFALGFPLIIDIEPIIVSKINNAFKSDSIIGALNKSTGVTKTALLMILNTLVPTMSEYFQTMTSTPLKTFKSEDDVFSFLNAVIKSGLSSDRGTLYILGNTAVGKTTLAETLKVYVEEPQRDDPRTILTGDNEDGTLLETEVAEVYPDQTLHGGKTVELTQCGKNLKIVQFKEDDPSIGKCILKTVDFGGQPVIELEKLKCLTKSLSWVLRKVLSKSDYWCGRN